MTYPLRLTPYLLSILIFSACSSTKRLQEGQVLYIGGTLELDSASKQLLSSAVKEKLEATIKPAPNTTIFGKLRPGLWAHNLFGEPKKQKGLKYWLKYKLGDPPVLLEEVNVKRIQKVMTNQLYNHGYFNPDVAYDIQTEGKKANITYTAKVNPPYTIEEVFFPENKSLLDSQIRATSTQTLLKKGENYNLEILQSERDRIDRALKNKGYFYFSPDYLLFQVDSTIGNHKLNVYLKLKENVPKKALEVYTVSDVNIYPDLALHQDLPKSEYDTVITSKGFRYIYSDSDYKPKVINRYIYLNKDRPYSARGYNVTLSSLIGMDIFKFVNIRYREVGNEKLEADIFLNPYKKKYLRLEANAVSKSTGFAGPGLNASFTNRNTFRGGEKLSLDLNSSFETQVSGQQAGVNSIQIGSAVSLTYPRFITPFNGIRQTSRFVPQTQFRIGYDYLDRVGFYRFTSFNTLYGYRWRETDTRSHELSPIAINFVALGQTSEDFNEILANNALIARSFEDQFIIGTTYSFTYNNQVKDVYKNYVYFTAGVDASGNLIHAVQSLVRDRSSTDEDPFRILDRPYAQYFKFTSEARFYQDITKKTKLATRVLAGIGLPFGNSQTLPYVKQYFIAGTNSIRAFPARSVGPGSYSPPDSLANNLFVDQVGDIKIEANAEFRVNLSSYFKWAFFFDIGNIWLRKDDPDRLGGQFKLRSFHREFAAGTGMGLRIDASYVVLRFDLGMPVRIPSNPEGQRWVFRNIDFGKRSWRQDNLVLNIAIGYPF